MIYITERNIRRAEMTNLSVLWTILKSLNISIDDIQLAEYQREFYEQILNSKKTFDERG